MCWQPVFDRIVLAASDSMGRSDKTYKQPSPSTRNSIAPSQPHSLQQVESPLAASDAMLRERADQIFRTTGPSSSPGARSTFIVCAQSVGEAIASGDRGCNSEVGSGKQHAGHLTDQIQVRVAL